MRCGEIKKAILAGYSSGEVSEANRAKIIAHIESCENCRAFDSKVKEFAIMPFSEAERYSPPERVWNNIENAVKREDSYGFLTMALEWIRENLIFKRTVFVAGTVAVLLTVLVLPKVYNTAQDKEITAFIYEEMDFFDSLGENNGSSAEDIGLPMEDFSMYM